MRKGARHRIFQENWDVLMTALAGAARPTPIRYIAMAYKSNLRELPALTRYLIDERRAWQVEIRYTYDVAHLPPAFRAAEFLDAADWAWLAGELAGYPAQQVQLLVDPQAHAAPDVAPGAAPAAAAAAALPPGVLPGRTMFRLSWDGTLKVVGVLAASRDSAIEAVVMDTNIHAIVDPAAFFADFQARAAHLTALP